MGQQFELKLHDGFQGARQSPYGRPLPGLHGLPAVIEPAGGQSHRGQPKAVKSRAALLPKDATAEDAFRLTLTQCKWHIAANVPALVEGRQGEGLHQLRVGLRRLRVSFTAFGGEFRTPVMEGLRVRAKRISAELSEARDLDVFVESLFEPAAGADGAKDAFAVLRARALAARGVAWDKAIIRVSAPSFLGFLRDLGEAVDNRVWSSGTRGATAANGIAAFEAPVTEVARRMLSHRVEHAKKRARHLEALSDANRHRLRIALKKMRYTSDFFAPLYPKKATEKFLGCLSEMQDILGTLNDVATARNILDKLVSEGKGAAAGSAAELSFAAGIVYGWQLQRADRIWKDAVKRWKKFARAEPFWAA